MASKIEVMYTSTLLNTMRLFYLSEYLFLSENQIPSQILQKVEKEILKQTKELAKSRKKIEEKMKKIKPKMYDPMWTVRHPIEVDVKPGRRESKKSREGSSMKNMKATQLKPFYEAVDSLEKETKEVKKYFQFVESKNKEEQGKKLEKQGKKSKATGNDHIAIEAHLFNEGALHYLNELFRCARSQDKDINSQTQADVFKKYIAQILKGKEALLQVVDPLAAGKKPNKFALFVQKAMDNLYLENLQKMPSKASRMQMDLGTTQVNQQLNNMAEYQEQKMKDLEAVEVKPFEELHEDPPKSEEKQEQQPEDPKQQEEEAQPKQEDQQKQEEAQEAGEVQDKEGSEKQEGSSQKHEDKAIEIEEVQAKIEQKEGGEQAGEAQIQEEDKVEEGIERETDESDIVPEMDEGTSINVVNVDTNIHTIPVGSPVRAR